MISWFLSCSFAFTTQYLIEFPESFLQHSLTSLLCISLSYIVHLLQLFYNWHGSLCRVAQTARWALTTFFLEWVRPQQRVLDHVFVAFNYFHSHSFWSKYISAALSDFRNKSSWNEHVSFIVFYWTALWSPIKSAPSVSLSVCNDSSHTSGCAHLRVLPFEYCPSSIALLEYCPLMTSFLGPILE